VKAAEAFFDAKGYDRNRAEDDLRRVVKRLRAERADEENTEQAGVGARAAFTRSPHIQAVGPRTTPRRERAHSRRRRRCPW
jgi:hypothetical protein